MLSWNIRNKREKKKDSACRLLKELICSCEHMIARIYRKKQVYCVSGISYLTVIWPFTPPWTSLNAAEKFLLNKTKYFRKPAKPKTITVKILNPKIKMSIIITKTQWTHHPTSTVINVYMTKRLFPPQCVKANSRFHP